jgi:hypothetical protein
MSARRTSCWAVSGEGWFCTKDEHPLTEPHECVREGVVKQRWAETAVPLTDSAPEAKPS